MKRGNLAFKVVTALFFLAVLAYIGVYLYTSIENPFSVTIAVSHTVYDSIDVRGMLVRDEIPVSTDYDIVYVTAGEAKKLPKDGVVAYVYSSQEELDKAVEIRNIQAQIDYLESYDNGLNANDPTQFQTKINKGLVELKRALNKRELTVLEDMSINLRTLAFFDGSETIDIEQSLSNLNLRLFELGSEYTSNSERLTAKAAGVFTAYVDGFEDIKPSNLNIFTPGSLLSLLEENRTAEPNIVGKIVCGTEWYYVAVIDQDDAKNLTVGNTSVLIFGKYYDEQLNMRIESIGDAENGNCIVVFSCDRALADTISMRRQSAEILKAKYDGIKVPKKAVRLDEDDRACVFVITGFRAEKKTINIIYESEDFYLVADEKDRIDALKHGDSIIVSAKELYDGKVIA